MGETRWSREIVSDPSYLFAFDPGPHVPRN